MLFTSSVFLLNHNYQNIVRIAGYFLVYHKTIKQIYSKDILYGFGPPKGVQNKSESMKDY